MNVGESHGDGRSRSSIGRMSRAAIGRTTSRISRLIGRSVTLKTTGRFLRQQLWAWPIIAAVLLLFPRTAHIGALLFLPIIANIAVLTSSVGFKGTKTITLKLVKGKYKAYCSPHESFMFQHFTVV